MREVGWRSVRILTLANNEVIIPNTRMAQSVIKNYGMPNEQSNISILLGVTYESNIKKEKKILEKICKDVMKKNKDIAFADPVVALSNLNESSVDFILIFKIKGYQNRFKVWELARYMILDEARKGNLKLAYNTIRIVN